MGIGEVTEFINRIMTLCSGLGAPVNTLDSQQTTVLGITYQPGTLQANIDKATAAIAGFDTLALAANGNVITASMPDDAVCHVTVFDNEGNIDFDENIDVIAGVAAYMLTTIIQGTYKVRFVGTTTYVNGYCEVVI